MPGLPRTGRSRTFTVPEEGASSPAIMLRMVDFPAPFGPRRPVTPAPIPSDRSETATTSPYHLATPSSVITGCSPGTSPGSALSSRSRPAASVTTLVPGEHHRQTDGDDRGHHPEHRGKRAPLGEIRFVKENADHRRDRPRGTEHERPVL